MARWSRRHWLWIVAGAAGGLLAVLADSWWQEWVETGRRYGEARGNGVTGPRCIP